jgi:4a-hydroxytetrahydrobiopterin dehydratase
MTHWKEESNALIGHFKFDNFSIAFSFMTQIALLSEKMNHHPDWSNSWNKVEIRLSTHDAGNVITQKDLDLAEGINKIYNAYNH